MNHEQVKKEEMVKICLQIKNIDIQSYLLDQVKIFRTFWLSTLLL